MTIEETIKNMPRRKTSGEHFYEKNFNPFALIDIDCSIRAVPAAIMMKYVDVCRHLGMGFKDGMAQGVETMDLSRLQASSLAKYFEKMKFINANGWRYSKSDAAGLDVMPAADVRVNVNDFCEAAGKVCPNEIFIVFCANNDGSYVDDIAYSQSDAGHVVAVYA